jgi:hypothetical protein
MDPLIIICILLSILILVIIMGCNINANKKWKCTEKGCELSIDGEHDTPEKCKSSCNDKL